MRLRSILPKLSRFAFSARSGQASETGWNGQGEGTIEVAREGCSIKLFESGIFTLDGQNRGVPMRNVYRWDIHADRIALSHERRGVADAVSLFDLVIDGSDDDTLVNVEAHQCAADAYSARLAVQPEGFDLEWRIIGPRKDERLLYHYRIR
ncbi:hypothetical protein BTW07_04615 [Salinicola socius]|uniref:DUF6314 domain-containing protein n=1 Tax=Salinicola socius TaxID=404433 RepID=A0A1Q8SVJ5_9GAMM|nr:hypothetical protein BTW07_04615 [Salinicola socius]